MAKNKRNKKKNKAHFSGGRNNRKINLNELIAPKSVSHTRKDIADFTKAKKMASLTENPRWYLIQQLITNILEDALLTSQYENRMLKVLATLPVIYKENGDIDDEQTKLIQNASFRNEINKRINESKNYRASVIELDFNDNNELTVELIPRENIDPEGGFMYHDYTDDKKTNFRELKEYGWWILEFNADNGFGLLSKAIPHVLFKRFALSCYSELCEIYGIPPRVLKTDTQNPTAMARSKKMMQDMGAAASIIIDDDEEFEFANGVTTNGDVYSKLINLCDNQNTMLISGAVIGQDTKNGSRSKDEIAKEMLEVLINSDLQNITNNWNNIVIPALQKIGILKGNVTYGYPFMEDIEKLWEKVKAILPFKNIPDDWLEEKFGIKTIGDRNTQTEQKLNLNAESFFV